MIIVALLGLVVLAGCGETTSDPGGPSTDSTHQSPPDLSPTPSYPTDEPTPPTSTATDPGTLVGVPEAGVEAGCYLLDGYLLLGGPRELLESGQEVQVTGAVAKGLATTCQQGTPFEVTSAEPVAP